MIGDADSCFQRDTSGEAGSGDDGGSAPTNAPGEVLPLAESTNVKADASVPEAHRDGGASSAFKSKKRGPPENGIPSSTKIMVANLPYELSEEKVRL